MKVGDNVEWVSQSQGFTKIKRGVVVAVVPSKTSVKSFIGDIDQKYYGLPRDHESYLVKVGNKKRLYWPSVKNLKLV